MASYCILQQRAALLSNVDRDATCRCVMYSQRMTPPPPVYAPRPVQLDRILCWRQLAGLANVPC